VDAALQWLDGVGDLEDPARRLFRLGVGAGGGVFHAAILSSLSTPRATILIASLGSGRCSALASSRRAHPDVALLIGQQDDRHGALGWIGSTTAFGEVVRKP
jgi:hypothetical protein